MRIGRELKSPALITLNNEITRPEEFPSFPLLIKERLDFKELDKFKFVEASS